MSRKWSLISILVFSLFITGNVAHGFFGTTPSLEAGEWVTLQSKIDWDLASDPDNVLPQDIVDFITREALGCRLSIRVASLEGGTVARHRYWPGTGTREVTLGSISTWESVNIENLIHELAHAGANGTGNDTKGYDKTNEVNARKREAESWKDASSKPARGAGEDQSCWSTYDMVFNTSGTQRSHDEIKKKLKTYGYSQAKM